VDGLRVMYCRFSCLMHYLATEDGSSTRPEHVELDQRLVSYTTAIFLSTLLLLLGLVLVF
jgi:hypothetical protein